MKRVILILLALVIVIGVRAQSAIKPSNNQSCSQFNPAVYEDPSREPIRAEILRLSGDLKNKTILDIGAGSGYFTYAFAQSGKNVIATELDQRFLDYIDQRKKTLALQNIETRLAKPDYTELNSIKNVDVAYLILVFHYLEDPKLFLTRLRNTLNSNGKIFIANYSGFSVKLITDYLEMTGFKDIRINKFTDINNACGDQVVMNIVSARK